MTILVGKLAILVQLFCQVYVIVLCLFVCAVPAEANGGAKEAAGDDFAAEE